MKAVALAVVVLFSAMLASPAPLVAGQAEFDAYGGWRGVTAPGGGTGFFRTAKIGDRWTLVTPDGHPFWMLAVYNVRPGGGGRVYADRLNQKYPHNMQAQFATQAVRRLVSWGFNALGEYTSTYALPLPARGEKTGLPEKLPFLRIVRPSGYALRPDVGVKDIVAGTDRKVYTGWRGTLADVFDPKFEEFANSHARFSGLWKGLDKLPWLIGTTVDDADNLRGFKRGGAAHPVWLVAVTAATQATDPSQRHTYKDKTVYSKIAWRDFLKRKYRTIGRLNRAWDATYTTFDSDGSWPSGKGLLDESGRNPWLRSEQFATLDDLPKAVVADLEEFLTLFAERYFSVVSAAVRAATPNHLVFGPAALRYDARPAILLVAAKYIDVFHTYALPDPVANVERFYDVVRKPIVLWLGLTAQADSPFSASQKSVVDYQTQEARGKAYGQFLNQLVALKGIDRVHFALGVDWWAWVDTAGEGLNWGLVSYTGDNAYDGKEAVVAPGRDAWGHPIGGESRNYGDFLSDVINANSEVWLKFKRQLRGPER